jgi:hypothetical protein
MCLITVKFEMRKSDYSGHPGYQGECSVVRGIVSAVVCDLSRRRIHVEITFAEFQPSIKYRTPTIEF